METFYLLNPKITKDVLLYYGFKEEEERKGYYYSYIPDYELRSGDASDMYPQTIVYHLEDKRVFLKCPDSKYVGDFHIERLNGLRSLYKLITGWSLNPQRKYTIVSTPCACGHKQDYRIPADIDEPFVHRCSKCGQGKSLFRRGTLGGMPFEE